MVFKIKNLQCNDVPILRKQMNCHEIVTVLEFQNLVYIPMVIKNNVYLIRYNEYYHVRFGFTTLHNVSVIKCKPLKSTTTSRSWGWNNIEDEVNNKLEFFSRVLPYYDGDTLYMMFSSDTVDEHKLILPVFMNVNECELIDFKKLLHNKNITKDI